MLGFNSIWPANVDLLDGLFGGNSKREQRTGLRQVPVTRVDFGGLAAATAAHIRNHWKSQPEILIVEPEAAPCLLKSVEAGRLVRAEGPLSNMGRLDCKDASLIAFESLRQDADAFMTIKDDAAERAVESLAAAGIQTTPSGAAGFAALQNLALPAKARAMIIVSEGPEG